MNAKRIAAGLYRLSDQLIVFQKLGRSLRLTGHNRRGNATQRCVIWVICRVGTLEDADILETLKIKHWRGRIGTQISEFDTLREALEAAAISEASVEAEIPE